MQDFTLRHANTFFFFTTIAVCILIIILLALLYAVYSISRFIQRTISRVDDLLDTAAEETETNPIYKKSLPYILPVLGYIFGKKGSARRKAIKHTK